MVSTDAAEGVLLGLACGDALGRPLEFTSDDEIVTDMQPCEHCRTQKYETYVLLTVLRRAVPGLTDPQWLNVWIEAFGWFAPIAFALLQATQIVVAPISGQLVAFVGGYAFEVVPSTIYNLFGAAIGSTIVFLVARRYGRPTSGER